MCGWGGRGWGGGSSPLPPLLTFHTEMPHTWFLSYIPARGRISSPPIAVRDQHEVWLKVQLWFDLVRTESVLQGTCVWAKIRPQLSRVESCLPLLPDTKNMTAINRFTVCIVSSLSTITFTFNMICIILKKKGINLGTRRKVVEMTRHD